MMRVQHVDTFPPHERDKARQGAERVPRVLLRGADRQRHPPDALAVEQRRRFTAWRDHRNLMPLRLFACEYQNVSADPTGIIEGDCEMRDVHQPATAGRRIPKTVCVATSTVKSRVTRDRA